MRRREFIVMLAAVAATVPNAKAAEQGGKAARIGYLSPAFARTPADQAFEDALRELGWINGQNVSIDYRYSAGRQDPTSNLTAEVVQLLGTGIRPRCQASGGKNANRIFRPYRSSRLGDRIELRPSGREHNRDHDFRQQRHHREVLGACEGEHSLAHTSWCPVLDRADGQCRPQGRHGCGGEIVGHPLG